MLNSTKELRVTEHDSQFLFSETCLVGFLVSCCLFPPPCTMSPHYSLNVSLSSLVHLAYLRDGHEDAREGAASSLHASLNTSPVAKTHMHTQPSYAFLLALTSSPTPLTCCVSVRPLKMFSSTLPPALSRCISIVSIERSGDERRKVANESMTENR